MDAITVLPPQFLFIFFLAHQDLKSMVSHTYVFYNLNYYSYCVKANHKFEVIKHQLADVKSTTKAETFKSCVTIMK